MNKYLYLTNVLKRVLIYIVVGSLGLISNANASVDSDLGDFFSKLGYQNNVTSPAAFHGQAAGYYTGGSLYLRNQVKNYQIVSVEEPSFSGGCSGIDSYLGSFSVINADEALQMIKKILSAGGAYAMDLALTTAVPQIKSVKDYIQKYVNDINSANINSCNTAEDLVGGLWPKTQASQQQICRDVGSHSGPFTDWASARQDCGTGGQFAKTMGDGGDRKSEDIVNKNIVWDALSKNTFNSNDPELSELLMNLSGSIIVKIDKKTGKPKKTTLYSVAGNESFIKALLHGGKTQIYACDEYKKCLNPTQDAQTITISEKNALVPRVAHMINLLNQAVVTDSGSVSPGVREFLEMTPIPILKFISNEAALGRPLDATKYSNVIAISLLDQYLSSNLQHVQEALSQEDTPMDGKLETQINKAQALISQTLSNAYKKLQNSMLLIDNMRVMEQQLASRLAARASVGQQI